MESPLHLALTGEPSVFVLITIYGKVRIRYEILVGARMGPLLA
jgi:hypothetical protein